MPTPADSNTWSTEANKTCSFLISFWPCLLIGMNNNNNDTVTNKATPSIQRQKTHNPHLGTAPPLNSQKHMKHTLLNVINNTLHHQTHSCLHSHKPPNVLWPWKRLLPFIDNCHQHLTKTMSGWRPKRTKEWRKSGPAMQWVIGPRASPRALRKVLLLNRREKRKGKKQTNTKQQETASSRRESAPSPPTSL